jgi:hypothetical protein
MSSNATAFANNPTLTALNPLDAVPDEIAFGVPYHPSHTDRN